MKRDSYNSIIPKIILILGTVSILGIILLFFRPRPPAFTKINHPETPEKLFAQVIQASIPSIIKLWEEGDRYLEPSKLNCPDEIMHDDSVGKSYYQCNPHFWQCFWQGGVKANPELQVNLFGQKFHLRARQAFNERFYKLYKKSSPGFSPNYGYTVEMEVDEIPGMSQAMILTDSCRQIYLPERIYGYGDVKNRSEEGFIWDNFGRKIFIDKFYVSKRHVNEWRLLIGMPELIEQDRKKWGTPAFLTPEEQRKYCSYYGKKLLEAKIFDAASMTPSDLKNPLSDNIYRSDTHWQRDLSKTFLGMARINPEYQLTPLDCQLAEVQGCQEKYYSTDSATWAGLHYSLGFYPEAVENNIEPKNILKKSSRFFSASSPVHELGKWSSWDGKQSKKFPVAFRCYEEVVP